MSTPGEGHVDSESVAQKSGADSAASIAVPSILATPVLKDVKMLATIPC